MPLLSDLPSEMFLIIADHLDDAGTNALASTNSRIYDLLNGYLYRRDLTNVTNPQSRSLVWSVKNGVKGTVQQAIAACRNLDPIPESCHYALRQAAFRGHVRLVKLLVEVDGMNLNGAPPPLYIAAKCGQSAIVELLLAVADIDPNVKDDLSCETPLHIACKKGHGSIAKQLLARHDIDVNARSKQSISPLHLACARGHVSIVKLLLARDDVDLNAVAFRDRSTPLMVACRRFNLEIVNLLLARDGIGINLCNIHGDTPVMLAAKAESFWVMESLLVRDDLDPNIVNSQGDFILGRSAVIGLPLLVKLILDRPDINPNLVGEGGRTGLMEACIKGNWDVVRLFLDREDIDVNRQDNSGSTALSLAAAGYFDNAEAPVDHTSVPEFVTRHLSVVDLLLERDDIDPNPRDGRGRTPLVHACLHNYVDFVRSLLSHRDTDPNPVGNDGVSLLAQVTREVTPQYGDEIESLLRRKVTKRWNYEL
jgi:ankyrin repeat protein